MYLPFPTPTHSSALGVAAGTSTRLGRGIRPVLLLALLMGCQAPADYSGADLYHGFTMIDPATERVVDDAYLVVENGRIREVGSGSVPRGDFRSRRDLADRYGLPGFVDAHAHITSGPHAIEVGDDGPMMTIESVDEITEFNARMALAFGVTTVRNPAGVPAANAHYDARVADGTWIGPDAVHAGPAAQPGPFGGAAFVYPRSEEEWMAEARRQADLGTRYFKLYVSLSEDELATGIRAAHAAGMRAIAHLDNVSWARAIELGIDDLTHALPTSADLLTGPAREEYVSSRGPDSRYMARWFELVDYDEPPMQELITALVENDIRVDLTLGVNEAVYNSDDLERVWPAEDQRFAHPVVIQASQQMMQASTMGWTPDDYERARSVAMPKVLELARRLHEAGVGLMIGTDGHGGTPIYARELVLHGEAGIPTWDVLRMATSQGAALLDLGDRTGRFDVGLEADVVFLASDPLADLANVGDVEVVLANGSAHDFVDLVRDVPPVEGSPE